MNKLNKNTIKKFLTLLDISWLNASCILATNSSDKWPSPATQNTKDSRKNCYILSDRRTNTITSALECKLDEHGVDSSYQDKKDEITLYKAVEIGDISLVKLLIEKGAFPNIRNKYYKPKIVNLAYSLAEQTKFQDPIAHSIYTLIQAEEHIQKYRMYNWDRKTLLSRSRHYYIHSLRNFIISNFKAIDFSYQNHKTGDTIMHVVVTVRDYSTMQFIIENSDSRIWDIPNYEGKTALDTAKEKIECGISYPKKIENIIQYMLKERE